MKNQRNHDEAIKRPKPPIHVGKLISAHLRSQRLSKAMLAKLTNRTNVTISRALKRQTIQVGILFEFSNALKHNFFIALANALPPEFSTEALNQKRQQQEFEALKGENEELKAQVKTLQEQVNLLIKRL